MVFSRKLKKQNPLNRNIITNLNPRSPIVEQYKTIRTNIQFSAIEENIRSLVITSSAPSEGKSTTVANLAIVFAQQGKKVLLIDADLRKPTVHYTFRSENQLGLTNVLTKKVALDQAIVSSDIENLSILTSGPIPPNPAELLGSVQMEGLMKEAYENFDLILLDTPPILTVTDAQILANQVSGTILVIGAGKTEKEAAKKATELLSNAKGKLLGVVLNQKKIKDSQYYYSYYYGES